MMYGLRVTSFRTEGLILSGRAEKENLSLCINQQRNNLQLKRLFTKCFLSGTGEEERNIFPSFSSVSVMPWINALCTYSKYLNEQRATNRLPPLKCKFTWQSWGKNCCYRCRWVCTCKVTLMPTSKVYNKGSQAEWQLPRGQSHS